MKSRYQSSELVFELSAELLPGFDRDASLHLTADVARITDDGLRGLGWPGLYDDDHPELADLTVTGYLGTDWAHTYGHHVSFGRPTNVELDRARSMVKVLGRVERRLERMSAWTATQDYNPPRDYTDYLLRVAKILGIRRFGTFGERRPNGTRPWVDLGGPDEAAAWLAQQQADYRERYPVRQHEEAS